MEEINASIIIWKRIDIRIIHTPKRFGYYDHIEIESIDPRRVPLPITETGYRSHFELPQTIAAYGGAAAYVQAWLEAEEQREDWQEQELEGEQLSLL